MLEGKNMKRTILRLGIALILVGAGWAAGRAQTSGPDFELIVNAPGGQTRIDCVRGCKLAWVERGVPPGGASDPGFSFSCTADRCSSAKVGGWVQK
jgi:hypothetical protein